VWVRERERGREREGERERGRERGGERERERERGRERDGAGIAVGTEDKVSMSCLIHHGASQGVRHPFARVEMVFTG
jgi:hypothetical protein